MEYEVLDAHEEAGRLEVRGRLDAGGGSWWEVVATVAHDPGPPHLVGLSVQPAEGGSATLTNEVLRQVPFGTILAEANRFSGASKDAVAEPASVVVTVRVNEPELNAEQRAAWWALRYVQCVDRGSRRPVADLAEEQGLKPSVVRDRIHDARERGMLPKSRPGLGGGKLTDKARAALERKER